jgi:hypothetical protein
MPIEQSWFVPPSEPPFPQASCRRDEIERIMYVGCVHGGDREFIARLNGLANEPKDNLPDTIIFTGDLPGAKDRKTIDQKRLFYNNLMNTAGPLLGNRPDISQNELLDAVINDEIAESKTLREGAIELLRFALEEMGEQQIEKGHLSDEIKNLALRQMTDFPAAGLELPEKNDSLDDVLFTYLQWIKKAEVQGITGLNSGTWVSTLPLEIRKKYLAQYKETAQALSETFMNFERNGAKVVWVQGNEDRRDSVDLMTKSFAPEDEFDISKYFGRFEPLRQITGIDGKTAYHLILPFFDLKDQKWVPAEIIENIKRAKAQGKKIVAVAHMHLDHSRHFATKPNEQDAKMTDHLQKLISEIKPDELVYPHQHWPMICLPAGVPETEVKYKHDDTIITYLPLMGIGILDLPIGDDPNRFNRFIRRES